MNGCESTAKLLPLSAAGLLDAAEERAVREHVRECAACAARLDSFGQVAAALAVLPAPAVPADLALRTEMRMAAEWEAAADRRRGWLLALGGSALAWISWFALWEGYRVLTEGFDSLARIEWPSIWIWLGVSAAVSFVAAPMAAALGRAQRRERRTI